MNGHFILDLSLSPPPPSPGIASDTDRKNLTLHTTSGPISADIWIRPHGRTKSKRVSLDLSSGNGPVRAIVVRPSLNSNAHPLMRRRKKYEYITARPYLPQQKQPCTSVSRHRATRQLWRCMSPFPVASAGQSPSAPVTTGSPLLLRAKSVRP